MVARQLLKTPAPTTQSLRPTIRYQGKLRQKAQGE
jgi:aminopeptidase N